MKFWNFAWPPEMSTPLEVGGLTPCLDNTKALSSKWLFSPHNVCSQAWWNIDKRDQCTITTTYTLPKGMSVLTLVVFLWILDKVISEVATSDWS